MKDRIKCVFYIDKKRKGQSVRKFQKGKRDFFKKFYNFVFRTVFLRIAFGYMDSETSISKREKPIVGRYCVFQFFSQTDLYLMKC